MSDFSIPKPLVTALDPTSLVLYTTTLFLYRTLPFPYKSFHSSRLITIPLHNSTPLNNTFAKKNFSTLVLYFSVPVSSTPFLY